MMKRMISLFLCMVMMLSMVPVQAIAHVTTENEKMVTELLEEEPTSSDENVGNTEEEAIAVETTNSDALLTAVPNGTCGDNLTWTLEDGVLTISGTGDMDFFMFSDEVPWHSYASSITEVSLPDGLGSIAMYTFAYCRNLKSVTIPKSVNSINSNAFLYSGITSLTIPRNVMNIDALCFQGCYDLTEIIVDPENEYYCSVDGIMFSKNLSTLYYYPCGISAEMYTVPDNVAVIGEHAFISCTNLKRIELPNGLTTIGFGAFSNLNIKAILIPASISNIGTYAFHSCDELNTVYYTGTEEQWNTLIENNMGDNNDSLLNVTVHCNWDGSSIPENPDPTTPTEPTEPEDDTISGTCGDNLTWTLQDNVLTISGTGAMTDYAYDSAPWLGNAVLEIVLPDGLTSIGDHAFQSSLISKIEIPGTVQEIGQGAFFYCSNLKGVDIPAGISSIADDTFGYCRGMTSISIPESVTSIGSGAFYYCSSLKNIEIPDGITSIAPNTFYSCNGLTGVKIPDGVTDIGDGAFNQCRALTEIEIPASVTSIGEMAFMGCESLVSVNIPNGVTEIKGSTFSRCKKLESISIPSSVSAIGATAFMGCTGLKTVSIPNGVQSIGNQVFDNCSSLESITIPDSVTSIGQSAFSGCSSLVRITIPNSVTTIGNNLCNSCESLVSVVISAGLTEIPYYSFAHCTSLKTVSIPDSITQIGIGAFSGCRSLPDITLPAGVTSIGYEIFYECTSLKSIVFSSEVYSILPEAFYGCNNLAEIYYPGTAEQWKSLLKSTSSAQNPPLFSDTLTVYYNGEGVPEDPEVPEAPPLPGEIIASGACDAYLTWTLDSAGLLTISGEGTIPPCDYWANTVDKEQVTYIVVESGITQLGNVAFHEMNNVLAIYLPETLFYISQSAFMNCTSLIQLKIPDGVVAIGDRGFGGCSALKQIAIPANVSHIGPSAFFACDALEAITVSQENDTYKAVDGVLFTKNGKHLIAVPEKHPDVVSGSYAVPSGVESIAPEAFGAGSWQLKEVSLPASLMQVGYSNFDSFLNVKDIHYSGTETMWERLLANTEDDNDFLESATVYFGNESATMPELPENIVAQGISGGLRWILDANGLLTISGSGAMQYYIHTPWSEYNPQIKKVVLEDGITNISRGAFGASAEGVVNVVTEITVPPSVAVIESFGECAELTEVILPGVQIIQDGAFAGCTGLVRVDMPESMVFIGERAFENCESLEQIVIPDGIPAVEAYTFEGCTSLVSAELPEGLTAIETYAFSGCSSLTAVIIPDSTVSIAEYAFSDCSNLSSLTTYEGLSTIGDNAFSKCGLGSANIPVSAEYIGKGCFSNNPELNISYAGTMEQWRGICVTITPAHCSDGTITAWGTCGDELEWTLIEGTLRIFGEGAMYDYKRKIGDTPRYDVEWDSYMSQIYSVVVEDDVTSVGDYAFYKHDTIQSVTLGEDVQNIGSYAFYGCEAMTQIGISRRLREIENYAFAHSGLTSVSLPYLTSDIQEYAFWDCNLETVMLSAIWYVGDGAFAGNPIKNVYFSSGQDRWNAIEFAGGNDALTGAPNIYFYSSGPHNAEELPPAYETAIEITPGTAATPELNYLLDYLIDWLDAYEQWVASVKDGLEDFAATEEESKENIIRQEAERMRTHDQNTNSRYLTGDLMGYESQAYHALSTFFYDTITGVPDFSSVDLSSKWADINLTNTLIKSMNGGSKTYYYDGVSISIEAIVCMGLKFGTMTIRDRSGTPISSIIICSDTYEGQKALTTYVGELQELGLNASFNVANAVCEDILGKSLTTLTSDYVHKAIAKIENRMAIKLDEKLGAAGVGKNLTTTLDECYNFYTWVKQCIDLGKEEDIIGTMKKIEKLEFKDTTVPKGATKEAMKVLRKAKDKMFSAFREYLAGTIGEEKQSFWRWLFGCPVSISVYNSAGEQIGYVGEDDIWYTDDICITELGGVKEIVSFTEEELSFTVTATDYGTMSCMFEQYDETVVPVGRLNYYNIILEPEQTFQVSIPEMLDEKTETVAITSGGEVFFPDEYIAAEDSAGVTITCSAVTEDGITGGTVSGTGTYIRGDSVILRAEPYDGFQFVGWFDGEHLIGTENICEFPARENRELTARFYQLQPILIELEADIGGSVIGSGRYDSGETVSLLAIPKNGYSFAGWYVGEEMISTDAEYSFQAGENLVLRAAFLYAYTYGQNVQIKLIEPWGIRANAKISTSAGVVDYDSLYDYGVYFIRKSALDRAGLTQSTITVADILNDTDAVKQTKADGITVSSGYLSAIYDSDIYTYELDDSVFVMFYFVTEEGTEPIYLPVRERNLKTLAQQRMNDAANFPNALERDVYKKMVTLEADVTDYRSDFTALSKPEMQKAPTLAQYPLGAAAASSSYTYGQNAQIKLIEPWGLKANVKVSQSGSVIDYNAVEEYGIVALADNSRTYSDASEILRNENAYVFSSKNGDASISGQYISATYSKDIYTYQLNTDIYVFGYVKDADGYHYGPVRNRNVYELMMTRKDDAAGFPNGKERTVYADMIDLYDAITGYREDYFNN